MVMVAPDGIHQEVEIVNDKVDQDFILGNFLLGAEKAQRDRHVS